MIYQCSRSRKTILLNSHKVSSPFCNFPPILLKDKCSLYSVHINNCKQTCCKLLASLCYVSICLAWGSTTNNNIFSLELATFVCTYQCRIWIQIPLGQWIRIHISQIHEGQNCAAKKRIKKFHVGSTFCWAKDIFLVV
jgi:hypothetical protein